MYNQDAMGVAEFRDELRQVIGNLIDTGNAVIHDDECITTWDDVAHEYAALRPDAGKDTP